MKTFLEKGIMARPAVTISRALTADEQARISRLQKKRAALVGKLLLVNADIRRLLLGN